MSSASNFVCANIRLVVIEFVPVKGHRVRHFRESACRRVVEACHLAVQRMPGLGRQDPT